MGNAELTGIVDGAAHIGSEELVDAGEGRGADIEAAGGKGGVRGDAAIRAANRSPGSVFGAWVEVELRIVGVGKKIGIEPDPVVIGACVDVVCGDDSAQGKLALNACGEL